jgi:hypothetical protein
MMQDRYRDRAAAMSPFNGIGDPKDIADVVVFSQAMPGAG